MLLNALLASLNAREHLREQVEGQMLSIRLPSGLRDVTTSNTGNIDGPQQVHNYSGRMQLGHVSFFL